MSALELVGLGEPDRWREALSGIPHGFAHTWESCHAHRLTTGDPRPVPMYAMSKD